MPTVTIKNLAQAIKAKPEELLAKLAEAGLTKASPDDTVSTDEKMQLIAHLRKTGTDNRVQMKRKTISQLKPSGKSFDPGVTVEVRKKRSYARQQTAPREDATPAASSAASPAASSAASPAASSAASPPASSAASPAASSAASPPASPPAATARAVPDVHRAAVAPEATSATPALRSADKPAADVKASNQQPVTTVVTADRPAAVAGRPARAAAVKKSKSETRVSWPATMPLRPDSDGNQDGARPRSTSPKQKGKRQELHVKSEKRGKRRFVTKKTSLKKVVKAPKHEFEKPTAPVKREVTVFENITVKDLAQGMAIKSAEMVKQMMAMGINVTLNQTFDQETAMLIVHELGHQPRQSRQNALEEDFLPEMEGGKDTCPRAPVITIMGHVDHGKTSLLDYMRKSQIVESEAGNITQHIGAYRFRSKRGSITFLDTPGHAAFSAMRARGVQLTDIVVLVVAADDSVKPQTEEAIRHAQSAEVPIIVAINKIDKPNTDIERVTGDLAQLQVVPEKWGGDSIFVEVSAKTGQGIDDLIEAILLQAEVMDLKAPVDGMPRAVVVEAALDRGRGAMITALVRQGVLRKGNVLLVGNEYGRVRTMLDENGVEMQAAEPSVPALVFGFPNVPEAGEEMLVIEDERKAKKIAELRKRKTRKPSFSKPALSSENFLDKLPDSESVSLKILMKGDAQGSVEALRNAVELLSTNDINVGIVASGIGGITESDVSLALASSAMIVGFNVRADARARKLLQANSSIILRYYSVIYEAIDDIKAVMSGLLKPELREQIIGIAAVKAIFRSSKFGLVAGSQVVEGLIKRGRPIRVLRDNTVIYEGELESLRHFKDEADEVSNGMECGIAVKNYNDVKVGDSIEVYERIEVERSL